MRYSNSLIKAVMICALLLLPSAARAGNWTSGTVSNAAGSRDYKLWVPAAYNGKRALPLVMMLHGCTQSPDDFATGTHMNSLAERQGFLVVYPEQPASANLYKCWNWFDPAHQTRDGGEPSLLALIVKQVSASHRVDARRIFVAGSSAGGAMAVLMGAVYPDIFAAVAVHSGLAYKAATGVSEGFNAMKRGGADPAHLGQLAYQAMGDARHMMRLIVFQGAQDSAVSPLNAEQVITQWARTNDYVDDAQDNESVDDKADKIVEGVVPGGYAYERFIYNDHAGRPLMERWLVRELKHAWSGGNGASYTDPKGPDASLEIWRFFQQTPPLRLRLKPSKHARR
jgi:poly(hydroxyalkanoate) depolymerase family esterase